MQEVKESEEQNGEPLERADGAERRHLIQDQILHAESSVHRRLEEHVAVKRTGEDAVVEPGRSAGRDRDLLRTDVRLDVLAFGFGAARLPVRRGRETNETDGRRRFQAADQPAVFPLVEQRMYRESEVAIRRREPGQRESFA